MPGLEALAFKASRGIEDIYELTCIRNDGSRFFAMVSITALRGDFGNIIAYLLIGTENSARKKVHVALKEAMSVAEKVSLAKPDFLSSISHELPTPLSAVLSFRAAYGIRHPTADARTKTQHLSDSASRLVVARFDQ